MSTTNTGLMKMQKWLKSFIVKARYTVNNTTYTTELFKVEEDGEELIFYVYLDDKVSGTVTRVQLIDVDGDIFDDQVESVSKPSVNGLLAAFRYRIRRG